VLVGINPWNIQEGNCRLFALLFGHFALCPPLHLFDPQSLRREWQYRQLQQREERITEQIAQLRLPPGWSSFAPAPDVERRCTKIAPKPSTTYNVRDMAACG